MTLITLSRTKRNCLRPRIAGGRTNTRVSGKEKTSSDSDRSPDGVFEKLHRSTFDLPPSAERTRAQHRGAERNRSIAFPFLIRSNAVVYAVLDKYILWVDVN